MLDDMSRIFRRCVPEQIKGRVRQQIWKRLNLKWTVKSGLKVEITNYADWVIYNDIFVDGEYDDPIRSALQARAHAQALTVLDIGANAGFFALRLFDRLRHGADPDIAVHVTLVEGSKSLCDRLGAIAAENNLGRDRVRIVHGLVGKRAGTGALYETEFHGENSVFPTTNSRRVDVDFVDLAGLFSPAEEIDLLKCDIEGSELLFLESYPELLTQVRSAVFELHHQRCDVERCKRLLRDAGFDGLTVLRTTEVISVCHFWRSRQE